MSIQGSINGAIGTAAAALATGKHISQQHEAVEKQKIANEIATIELQDKLAAEQSKTGEEIAGIKGEIKGIQGQIKEKNAEIKELQNSAAEEPGMGTPEGGEDAFAGYMNDLKALKKSKSVYNQAVKAKKLQVAEREEHIARLNKIIDLQGGMR